MEVSIFGAFGIRDLHGPDGYNLGPTRKRNWNLGPSPVLPETKYKILARVRPGQFFFSDFSPDSLD